MMTYLLLALGFVFLLKGADLLVTGATDIALKFKISDLVIGLTIVSFGTSLPEVIVCAVASLNGHAELAIANVLGSNIANVLLVLGVAAMIRALPVNDATVLSEIPFSLTAALLVGFLANVTLFSTTTDLSISRLDGAILLFFFALFMLYVYKVTKARSAPRESEEIRPVALPRSLLLLALGMLGLYLGGRWVVDGAIVIARGWGLSESLIGLTVVAIGTSLPELMASAVAAYRGKTDIAVGNVVGSNIFNLLWVLAISALISELPFNLTSNTDLVIVIVTSTLIIVAMAVGRKSVINRGHGVAFVLAYAAYLAFVIHRG